MFSAKKVSGQALYKLARQGKTILREPRVIRIQRFEMLDLKTPKMSFIVESSKGAYIRTLAHDLGQKIDVEGASLCTKANKGGVF